ncbi:MAG TPA: hypothetical protein VGE00_03880 [Gammaproteobacteria bacterium]
MIPSTPLRRLPALLLLLAMVAVQWGWLGHEYQAHDSGQVCEVCVAGASLGHGITPSATIFTPPSASAVATLRLAEATILPTTYRHTLGQRGPPALS